jgi:hypothetical protein
VRGSGVVRSWRVLRSTAPPNDAARPRFSRPRAELVTLPLTLSVARRCGVDRSPLRAGVPGSISAPSRQRRRFCRPRAPSIDQCSLAGTRHRSHDFAVASRLPALVRSSLPKVALRSRGARPDAFPRGPSAARRLLQSKQSASTCRRSSDPWPRPEVALSDGSRWAAPPSPRIQRSVTKKRGPSRGFTGQGPGWLSPFRHLSSRLLVTRALPQPDPLGHLLSWTGGVTGWIVRERQARARGVSLLRVHPSSSLARSPPRPWSAHLRGGRG